MFAHQRAAVEAIDDKDVGAGIKAAFRYFDGEDVPQGSISAQAFIVFCVMKPYIDESFRDFEKSVESGKEGARRRWERNSPPIPPFNHPVGVFREAEAEAEAETETEAETSPSNEGESKRAGARKPPRFLPPTVEQVAEYVKQRGSAVDPQGFIDFYAAKGWLIGKTPMKDWKAACRNAEGWERWTKPVNAPKAGAQPRPENDERAKADMERLLKRMKLELSKP